MNIDEDQTAHDDHYNSDDGILADERLKPMRVNYEPSPSPPPAVALPQVSSESSPEPSSSPSRKGSNRSKSKNQPSQGDAVIVSFMGGGKQPDIARAAGKEALPSDDEGEDMSVKGATHINMGDPMTELHMAGFDLSSIAASALAQHEVTQDMAPVAQMLSDEVIDPSLRSAPIPATDAFGDEQEALEDLKANVPSIVATMVESRRPYTPDMKIKTEGHSPIVRPVQIDGAPTTAPLGGLPPIRAQTPTSALPNGSTIKLPSISDQLGDLSHLADSVAQTPTFSQSPPGRPGPPQFPPIGHGSPPRSPNDVFRNQLPSPGRGPGPYWRRPSQADTSIYGSAGDYSSSNTETPSTDQSGSTPAMMGIDRMSIDNMTNPQIGGFQCTYPGCTAQPFQTQYLLNSHANVHSSNRPHYCSVKGCPRSEGGKGFKRKNEMIRHGLVHDSPGYVCPFCPDREHKYPRPDNLQRHVRVHHVDKDKDDPQLRDVLSQRPEGPSKGRRRRGGPS